MESSNEQQELLTDEQKRQQVREKVTSEFIQRHTKPDGTMDYDAMAEDYFKRDEKLHYTRAEAKDRRLREESYVKDLETQSKELKAIKEKELLEQKKFEELIKSKEEEINKLTSQVDEIEDLKKFKQTVFDSQKLEIENKIAKLGKDQLELYNMAIAAMSEDAIPQKLALLNKMLEKNVLPAQLPAGGVSSENKGLTQESLIELKEKDPVLYRQRLRERVRGTKEVK